MNNGLENGAWRHEEESIKGNTLAFTPVGWFVAFYCLAFSMLRFGVVGVMGKNPIFGDDRDARDDDAATQPATTELAALAESFARFRNRYCESKPRSAEELRVIHAPLGFEPN